MKKLMGMEVQEFKYDSETEREQHIKEMKEQGFECASQSKRSDDSIWKDDREYYWFAHFCKYC